MSFQVLAERMMTVIKRRAFHHTKLKCSDDISKSACEIEYYNAASRQLF